MEAARPRRTRRRPRRGLLEQPVNVRLVRNASFLVAVPIVLAAFTVARPGPLAAPALPPSFDGTTATTLTRELARDYPSRVPGSPGSDGAARWYTEKLALYGFSVETDTWRADVPDLGVVELRNLAAVVPGPSRGTIVIVAHRDNSGRGPGANDNASGTAALIELARAYAQGGTTTGSARPQHTLVFLSTDGGAFGSLGAARFASASRFRPNVLAVVVLEALAGRTRPRLEIAGDHSRSPAAALVRTAAVRVGEQLGREPDGPSILRQLVDLGVPFAYGEQAPFLGNRISAIRVTTADDSGRSAAVDSADAVDAEAFERLGRAAQALLGSLDGGLEFARGTAAYVYLGERIARGWALALVFVAALLPFLVGVVDLLARCRRRRLPLAPALRSLRSRLLVWLWAGVLLWVASFTGVLPTGIEGPLPPDGGSATDWPIASLTALAALLALGWFLARRRIAPTSPIAPGEEIAGYAVGLGALGAVAVLTAVVNPLAVVFVLPSLYAWLWLPETQRRSPWLRDALYGLGLAGPVLVLVSLATRFHLGVDVFLYVLGLASIGYVPWTTVVVTLLWAAVATQMGAIAAGRYAPYTGGASTPPRGPIRNAVRRAALAAQRRRR